jgi:hypothetical protein
MTGDYFLGAIVFCPSMWGIMWGKMKIKKERG